MIDGDTNLLELHSIVKDFPGTRALDGVDLSLRSGEFHALVGENGAGKSTLIKILAGVYPESAFTGEILINGSKQVFKNIRDSERAGISIIFQELSLVPQLTVAENIFLGREASRFGIIDRAEADRRTAKLLGQLKLGIDADARVETLGIGQQQLVEIAKALVNDSRILVLDEPTAALSDNEVESLFTILRRLLESGVGMIYVSHKLDEVFQMSDAITVLRDGRTVATYATRDVTRSQIIESMVGREVSDVFPRSAREPTDDVLNVRGLTVRSPNDPRKKILDDVSFDVRRGEVLGIVGLMGAGRTELLMTLFGAGPGRYKGTVKIDGNPVEIRSPQDAIRNGIALVTEDRKSTGLLLDQTIRENVTLPALRSISGRFVTDHSREDAASHGIMKVLGINARSPQTITGALSGGNQQKVVLGKWLLTSPKFLLLDEPTRGIDVGAKREIYAEIMRLADAGVTILLVSSELPEVLGLSDRVLVLFEGRVTGRFDKPDANAAAVMLAATGHQTDGTDQAN